MRQNELKEYTKRIICTVLANGTKSGTKAVRYYSFGDFEIDMSDKVTTIWTKARCGSVNKYPHYIIVNHELGKVFRFK